MASDQPSTGDIRTTILEDGFYYVKDPVMGERIQKMDDDAIPFASELGLQFYKVNILENLRIRPVLNSIFEEFSLGLYRSLGGRPGAYSFRTSGPGSTVDCLLIHLLSKESVVTFWGGSHGHLLPSYKGENNLWRVPEAAMKQLAILPTTVTFEQGGFAVLDARTPIEIAKGSTTTFAIGSKEVVGSWYPMTIPRSLEQIVQLMESPNCRMHVKYY